jgi:glucosamine 6-phosphate synthetase-like amidotransferase/phosphosugar isomerase protein
VTIRKELLEIPEALQQMAEEGRPSCDALVRRINWGDKPVFIIGDGPSYPAALGGAWAFESILGTPAVVRRPAAFSAVTSQALAVRSLVIVVDGPQNPQDTLAAAVKAKHRGAIVWAVTSDPAGELVGIADGVVNDYAGEPAGEGPRAVFCRHAAILFLAVAAAKVLKAPTAALNAQEEELGRLGQHVEWVVEKIPDAASALAKELAPLDGLALVGGGAFHPVALQAAERLRRTAGTKSRGFDLLDFQQEFPLISQPDSGIVYLSSSRCGLKAQVHQSASEARQQGKHRILAVTDANDRQLTERADLSVLLPGLTEAGGALVALAFLELVAYYTAQAGGPATARRRKAGS